MKIVIARYNENINWIKKIYLLLNKKNVIIFNKGKNNIKEFDSIPLENVGREGHTYYKYIYDNYNNLDDYTIFLQGNPFDHSPEIIKSIKQIINMKNNNNKLNINFNFLTKNILKCNLSGCSHHHGLPLIDVYEKLFNKKKDKMDFIFGAGAQFIVSKKQILERPRDFYLKIINLLNNNINPIEGFVIERFHKLIFS